MDEKIAHIGRQALEIASVCAARGTVTALVDPAASLAAESTLPIEPASRNQRHEAGRIALRRATDVLGVSLDAIARDERGAPVLPPGLLGSISHVYGLSIAVAARGTAFRVGVDLERNRPARPRIGRRVLTDAEWLRIEELPEPQRWRAILAVFCAKEAAYKALDGLTDAVLTFKHVEVVPETSSHSSLRGWVVPLAQPALRARVAVEQDDEFTVAIACSAAF